MDSNIFDPNVLPDQYEKLILNKFVITTDDVFLLGVHHHHMQCIASVAFELPIFF